MSTEYWAKSSDSRPTRSLNCTMQLRRITVFVERADHSFWNTQWKQTKCLFKSNRWIDFVLGSSWCIKVSNCNRHDRAGWLFLVSARLEHSIRIVHTKGTMRSFMILSILLAAFAAPDSAQNHTTVYHLNWIRSKHYSKIGSIVDHYYGDIPDRCSIFKKNSSDSYTVKLHKEFEKICYKVREKIFEVPFKTIRSHGNRKKSNQTRNQHSRRTRAEDYLRTRSSREIEQYNCLLRFSSTIWRYSFPTR